MNKALDIFRFGTGTSLIASAVVGLVFGLTDYNYQNPLIFLLLIVIGLASATLFVSRS